MNAISIILLILIAAAVGFGIYRTVQRRGRCSGCTGDCAACGIPRRKTADPETRDQTK